MKNIFVFCTTVAVKYYSPEEHVGVPVGGEIHPGEAGQQEAEDVGVEEDVLRHEPLPLLLYLNTGT